MRNELKHLNRKELIDIIYQLKKSERELQAENEHLRSQLEEKRISLSEAGSIADASLVLTDLFSVAQTTADMYLAEIEQRREECERDYTFLMNDAHKKSEDIICEAREQRDAILTEVKKAYVMLKKYNTAIEKKKMELAMYSNQE